MTDPKQAPASASEQIRQALDRGQGTLAPLLAKASAAQVADAIEALAPERRGVLWSVIALQLKGPVLFEVRREVRQQLIAVSRAEDLTQALQRLDLDKLSDLYPELPPAVARAVLDQMDPPRRARFQLIRGYPDDSAGGLMNTDTVSVQPESTLAMTVAHLGAMRAELGRLPPELDAVSVVDADGRYLGSLSLVDLVSLDPARTAGETMDSEFEPIPVDLTARRVARRFEDEDLVSAPVVDAQHRLIGRITVDDVMDFVRAQGEAAQLAAGGLTAQSDTFAPAWRSARHRALWLGINLSFALLATVVIGIFDATIERLVALAVLMPVVSSMGGVAGTQSLSLVLRALALEQVDRSNQWRLLRRELGVAAINGVLWAAVVGALTWLWFGNPMLSVVFGAAIVLNLVAGVAAGTLIPLVLQRTKVDAAIAGEVLLVAFTDTFGFFAFLGLAALTLH